MNQNEIDRLAIEQEELIDLFNENRQSIEKVIVFLKMAAECGEESGLNEDDVFIFQRAADFIGNEITLQEMCNQ